MPCSREVVADNEIALPLRRLEAIVDKFDKIAVSPASAAFPTRLWAFPDPGDHPLETCITLGEEAEYYIENGIGREIDKKRRWKSSIAARRLRHGHSGQLPATTEVICNA